MKIRLATIQDAPSIAGVDAITSEARTASDYEAAAGDGNYRLYVLTEDDEVRAFVLLTLVCGEAELLKIAVDEDRRGRGLATNLLSEAVRELKNDGAEFIFLEVRADNVPAIKLYENCGFKPCRVRKNFYREPVCDALTYRIDLVNGEKQ